MVMNAPLNSPILGASKPTVWVRPQERQKSVLEGLSEYLGVNLSGLTGLPATTPTGSSLPPISYPDTTAARNEAFARGKDKAAQNARASLRGLTEAMASRNMLGSGVEAAGQGAIIGRAGQGVSELIREQTIQDANAAEERAAREYQGRIQQRGQDINVAQEQARRQQQALESLLSLAGILY